MHAQHTRHSTITRRPFCGGSAASGVALILALVTTTSVFSIGCASSPPPPEIDPLPYQGPPVVMGSKNDLHVAIITAPTPGWVPSLDRMMDGPGAREVFISMREPNPAFLRAQVTVDQHIATAVPMREAVRVHVRTLRWDDEDIQDLPYALAASAVSTESIVLPPPSAPQVPASALPAVGPEK